MEPSHLSYAQQFPVNPVWFALGFPLFWGLTTYLLGEASGWRNIHAHFGNPPGPLPAGRSFRSGRIGPVKYNGVLRIAHDGSGLHLAVLFPFRIGHPPLFIPWSSIGPAIRTKEVGTELIKFNVGRPSMATLELYPSDLKGTALDSDARA